MLKKTLGIGFLAVGLGVGLFLILSFVQPPELQWDHPAFAAAQAGGHASAPTLQCFDCHGSHPDKTQVPQASDMLCFDCHTVTQ